jgi:hypothetical protein
MGPTFFFLRKKKKPRLIPEPSQRVRLRTARGRWRGTFRAVSEPYTDEAGEVVVRVAKESEYQHAISEGRRAGGMPWPVGQIEVVLPLLEDDGERTQELPQRLQEELERTELRPAGGGAQEPSERPWWRTMFGG